MNGTGYCLNCHDSCLTCFSGQPSSCMSCHTSAILTAGYAPSTCTCAPGKFMSSGVCYDCHISCSSCVDGMPNNCTECASGYVAQGSFPNSCMNKFDYMMSQNNDPLLGVGSDAILEIEILNIGNLLNPPVHFHVHNFLKR